MHHRCLVLNLIFCLLLFDSNIVIKFFEKNVAGNAELKSRDLSQIKALKSNYQLSKFRNSHYNYFQFFFFIEVYAS